MTATAPPAANRVLLTTHAADLRRMAGFAARAYRLDPDDVRQQMAALVLAHGHKFDPARGWGFRRWLWMGWRSATSRELRRPRPLSLDALATPTGEPFDPADPRAVPAEETAERTDVAAAVRAAVAGLEDSRRRAVVEAVFGLTGGGPETATAVAARFGVSPSRASQLARDALDRLRVPLAGLAD